MATDTTEKKNDPRTVKLQGVRLSFTDSLKDKKATVDGGDPKHSVNLILETDSKHFKDNKEKCRIGMEEAGEQEFKNREAYVSIMDDDPKRVCYRKGERFKNKETQEVYKGYAGNWAIACGTPGGGQKRPRLIDRAKRLCLLPGQSSPPDWTGETRVISEAEILDIFYGGSYADVFVSFYGTDKGGRGIFCTVDVIRSHERGERMGNTGPQVDADDFEDLEDDADDAFEGGGAASSADPLG